MKQDLSGYNKEYYSRELPEYWFGQRGLLRPDQLAAVCYSFGLPFWGDEAFTPRDPGQVYSIGCGLGSLELALEQLGVDVIGVDPSDGAKQLYKGGHRINRYHGGGDTIIFCESIEHIPEQEIKRIFNKIPKEARVIVVNWPVFHPIPALPGNDHITTIDDAFFDRLSDGRKVVLRRMSHLVLEGESQ